MSYFHRPPDTLEEHSAQPPEYYPVGEPEHDAYEVSGEEQAYDDADPRPSVGAKVAEFAGAYHARAEYLRPRLRAAPEPRGRRRQPDRRRSGRG